MVCEWSDFFTVLTLRIAAEKFEKEEELQLRKASVRKE